MIDFFIRAFVIYFFGNNNPIALQDSVTYCFQVRLTNKANITGNWSSHKCTTSDLTPPIITVSVIDQASGIDLIVGKETFLPFIIAGDAKIIDIYSNANDVVSGIQEHKLSVEGIFGACSGDLTTCNYLAFDLEAEGGSADFSVTVKDNANNLVIKNYFIVPNALANFNIHDIFIVLGESIDIAVSVRNLKNETDNVTLELDRDNQFTVGVAAFIENNQKNLNVTLGPYEKRTIFVKLIGTDVTTGFDELFLDAASEIDSTVTAHDALRVFVVFPAAFPGLEMPAIILLIVISSLIYIRISKFS